MVDVNLILSIVVIALGILAGLEERLIKIRGAERDIFKGLFVKSNNTAKSAADTIASIADAYADKKLTESEMKNIIAKMKDFATTLREEGIIQ